MRASPVRFVCSLARRGNGLFFLALPWTWTLDDQDQERAGLAQGLGVTGFVSSALAGSVFTGSALAGSVFAGSALIAGSPLDASPLTGSPDSAALAAVSPRLGSVSASAGGGL